MIVGRQEPDDLSGSMKGLLLLAAGKMHNCVKLVGVFGYAHARKDVVLLLENGFVVTASRLRS